MNVSELTSFQQDCHIFLATWSLLFSIITVIGNSLLLFTLYLDPLKCFRTPSSHSIASLAVSDLMAGIFVDGIHFGYSFEFAAGTDNASLYEAYYNALYVCTIPSMLLMVVIATERLIAVQWPMKYRHLAKPKKIFVLSSILWIYSICFAIIPYIGVISPDVHYNWDLCFHIFFPLVTSSVIYILVYAKFKRKIKFTSDLQRSGNTQRERRNIEKEKATAIACFIVLACFFISFIPYLITVLLEIYCSSCQGKKWYFFIRNFSNVLQFVNASSNPFIYAWKLPSYRRSLLRLLRKRFSNTIENIDDQSINHYSRYAIEPTNAIESNAERFDNSLSIRDPVSHTKKLVENPAHVDRIEDIDDQSISHYSRYAIEPTNAIEGNAENFHKSFSIRDPLNHSKKLIQNPVHVDNIVQDISQINCNNSQN